jgi:Tfp pilus assembly protein PilP
MMKLNLIQIAAVVLSAGTALAQTSQPLTGSSSSTSQVKAAPVQIKPKSKPASTTATSPTTADKNKVSSAPSATKPQVGAAAKPVLTIKPAPGQPKANSSAIKTASPTQASASGKGAAIGAKPSPVAVQAGKAAPVQPTKAPAKASPVAAQTSSKPANAQSTSKTSQAAPAAKANAGTANQKPVAPGVAARKPAPAATGAKTSVAQKPGAPMAGTQAGHKPGSAVAAKPVAHKSGSAVAARPPKLKAPTAGKKRQKAASKAKVSAIEQPVKPAATEQAAAPAPKRIERAGRRDPFVSPIHQTGTGPAGTCATGKRCLDIEQLVLKGIVQTREGNMALVENGAKRPYILRVNDALFNGTVERITGDSVLFRQNVQDVLGRTSTREVVKRVTAPAV